MAAPMDNVSQDSGEGDTDDRPKTQDESSEQTLSALKTHNAPINGRSFLRELLTETIIGVVFWSVFQELVPSVAVDIVKHGQTDYFAYTAVWFSPAILLVPAVFAFLQSPTGLLLLRIVMVASLSSMQASTPQLRLGILAGGNFAAALLLCCSWWHKSCHQRSASFWGTLIGFVSLLTLRIWFVTINPFWASTTGNNVLIALGFLAALDRFSSAVYPLPEFKPNEAVSKDWMLMGLGFGSLLFFTQWIFGEVSVICRWGTQGYPNPGPYPLPAGVAVFVELLSGVLLSTNQKLQTNFLWIWFVGGHMTIGLYYLTGFMGFACGLILGPFVMSSWAEIADRVTSCRPVHTMIVAMAGYTASMYFSIAAVVPGLPYGFLINGRAIWLIVPLILLIGRSLLRGPPRHPEEPGSTHIAFSNLDGTGCYQMFADAKIYIIIILLTGVGGFAQIHLSQDIQRPGHRDPVTVTGALWDVQFMLDNDGMMSNERVADFLHNTEADVIALVQSDSSRLFLGNRDTSLWLSQRLHMFDEFGPASSYHTSGVSLLSRYPIVKSEHTVVNSTEGPMVPVLTATLNISANLLDVVVAQFPKQRFNEDKRYHMEFISNFTRRSTNPVLFLATLSSEPGSGDYRRLKTFGKLKDIDPTDNERFTLSIMYKNLIRLGFARVSQAELSDNELQMAKFQFTSVKAYKDNEHVTTETSGLDKGVIFPQSFGGYFEGMYSGAGHSYQMGSPRYFIGEPIE